MGTGRDDAAPKGAPAVPERALLLAGMMGAGKSTVGRALARRLGWEFIDTDERVTERSGRSIAELFALGEESFRRLESAILAELPERGAVVALGGGAVVAPENRALLDAKGVWVWLDARPETLAERVGTDSRRPLLAGVDAGERLARLRALRDARAEAYAHARARVETDGLDVEQVCDAVLRALGWECAA
jgi:shikimate kinase